MCRKNQIKSLGQAFSKACRFLGQRPKSLSAESEKLYLKRFFAGVWGAFFKKKSAPQVNNYHNKILEKGAGGTFFDRLNRKLFGLRLFLILPAFQGRLSAIQAVFRQSQAPSELYTLFLCLLPFRYCFSSLSSALQVLQGNP